MEQRFCTPLSSADEQALIQFGPSLSLPAHSFSPFLIGRRTLLFYTKSLDNHGSMYPD
jgi:hypothetical protein